MPQMGESIAEGTVSRWLKSVGDTVKRDEPILEISTDKVDAEIPSPSSGTLAEIKVKEGETVEVMTVVAVLETDADVAAVSESASSDGAVAEPAPKEPGSSPATSATPPPPQTVPSTSMPDRAPTGSADTAEERLRQRSTPLVRKMAADYQVDISTLPGTGHAGRVTKKDLAAFVESGRRLPATAPPSAPASRRVAEHLSHPHVEAWAGDSVEPMSKIRKLTADHMIMSRRTSAHVTSFYEIDFTKIAGIRRLHKAAYEERGAKLTYMAFIIKSVADNLRQHPVLNASVSEDQIIYRKPINIGIAVALDWGLIVPVIRNADELSVLGIAKSVADLADRARTKRLSPDEVQKGTFTITNPGVFGSYIGTPIINQPQVGILGIGAIEKRPKVITLADGQDVIAIRTMSMFSISYDHRIVDGADADRFMAGLKQDLEQFPEESV
jgi:2-oxoglutarate dehydrogenase E2 component (dihydrolipoamide succinyltransferase)